MRNAKRMAVLAGSCVLALGVLGVLLPQTAAAKSDVRSIKALTDRINAIKEQLEDAKYTLDVAKWAGIEYGNRVGRWTWLARDVGWPKEELKNLLAIIYRESRGVPSATNSSSNAAGLLQFMPQWYTGLWSLPAFDPYHPRTNLSMGLKLWKQEGWSPWSL